MKTTLRKRLSYLLLSLLGFASACDREPAEMYGVPRADTRTQGRVTDKSGNPIPGIQVRSNGAPSKAVRTMADGSYDIADESASRTAWLTFTDTDGPENGGQFAEKSVSGTPICGAASVEVTFTEADRTAKGDGWYEGGFARTGVDVTLEEKK